MTVATVITKACTRCHRDLPLEAFNVDAAGLHGKKAGCRECLGEIDRARRARDVDLHRERCRVWYRENRGHVLAKKAAQPIENIRAVGARRRARELGAAGDASPEAIRSRFEYYGCRCWMCGTKTDGLDHVIPLSRGGTNWPANIRPACGSCNSWKSTRLPSELDLATRVAA